MPKTLTLKAKGPTKDDPQWTIDTTLFAGRDANDLVGALRKYPEFKKMLEMGSDCSRGIKITLEEPEP